jgi:hypothetical protein
MSLALSSGVASALSAGEIKGKIQNLMVHYEDEAYNKAIGGHDGWLDLLSDVLGYAEATEADVTAVGSYETQHWADWLMRADGFRAAVNAEEDNLRAMLTNFNHSNYNEGYFESNWRVKNDFKLLLDWGAINYTVQNREGQEKPYKGYCYDEAKFLQKIREIYNLDPSTNAQKYDALCLRAIFRAMVEYDKFLGAEHEPSLDSFVDGMSRTGLMEELICLIASCSDTKDQLGTAEDFSLQDRVPRQNAVDFYKRLARLLLSVYYEVGDNLVLGQGKLEDRDYKLVFDDNGYVVRIEPIVNPAGGAATGNGTGTANGNQDSNPDSNPNLITLKPGRGKRSVGGSGLDPMEGYIIKRTGFGIDHFAAAVVALAISASGVAGLGYVVSREKRKNVR